MTTQNYKIDRKRREERNGHLAFTIWLTGLSGAGKSTIADGLEQYLFGMGIQVYVLDGDNIRTGLNKDLDFSKAGRSENIRRISETARLFNDAGVVTITAFISPYIADRAFARQIIGADKLLEVYVDAPLETCIERDVKGLYTKARQGLIPNFTGISDIYEPPLHPDMHLDTGTETVEESVNRLVLYLQKEKLTPR